MVAFNEQTNFSSANSDSQSEQKRAALAKKGEREWIHELGTDVKKEGPDTKQGVSVYETMKVKLQANIQDIATEIQLIRDIMASMAMLDKKIQDATRSIGNMPHSDLKQKIADTALQEKQRLVSEYPDIQMKLESLEAEQAEYQSALEQLQKTNG